MLVFGSVPPPPFFVNRYNSPGRLDSWNFSRCRRLVWSQNAHLWSWFQEIPWGHFEAQETWHDSSCKQLQNDLKIAEFLLEFVVPQLFWNRCSCWMLWLADFMFCCVSVVRGVLPLVPQKKAKCLSVCLVMAVCFSFRLDDQLELFLYPCNSGSYTPDFLLLIPKNDGFYKVSPWKHRYLFSIPMSNSEVIAAMMTKHLVCNINFNHVQMMFQVQVFVGMKCEVLNQSRPPSGIEQCIKSLRVKNCFCTPTSRLSMAKILLPEGNRLITLWFSCFAYFDRLTIWWTLSDSSYHMVIPNLSKRNLAFSIGVVAIFEVSCRLHFGTGRSWKRDQWLGPSTWIFVHETFWSSQLSRWCSRCKMFVVTMFMLIIIIMIVIIITIIIKYTRLQLRFCELLNLHNKLYLPVHTPQH